MAKAQVWVETAVYTLIALTIISIVLASALPTIQKSKDRAIIKQTIDAIDNIDKKIYEVIQNEGSIRKVDLIIQKGRFEINSSSDSLIYTLDNTKLEYSEPGITLDQGNNIYLTTYKQGARFRVIVEKKYPVFNITYFGEDKTMILQAGARPNSLLVENVGAAEINSKIKIDFSLL
ncbi:MAG: hypothetical protein ACP5OG_00340 [Candidatus Nanoarchaeia archaeon]